MILALLLAHTALPAADRTYTENDPVGVERAFDEAAAHEGQWTAFRRFAAPDAIMFSPKPWKAKDWLKDRRDPPTSVRWQLANTYIAADGDTAVNTGPWQAPDGSRGFFVTVWQRQSDGRFRWLLDFGGPSSDTALTTPRGLRQWGAARAGGGAPEKAKLPHGAAGGGYAADHSVRWWYTLTRGRRTIFVDTWSGYAWSRSLERTVIE